MSLRAHFLSSIVVGILACAGCSSAPGDASAPETAPVPIDPATRVHVSADSDTDAIRIAQAVVEKSGGWAAWDASRYLRWNFFGRRYHHWDRYTGDLRIDSDDAVIVMNLQSGTGRAWEQGVEVTDADKLGEILDQGQKIWINDSYWMFLPFKLLDPGVTLKYSGERVTDDGLAVDVLDLTFDAVGETPRNRYEVLVGKESGLIEAWTFFADRDDAEPGFTMPWKNWQRFGGILLATDHGRAADWNIAVLDELPPNTFTDAARIIPAVEPAVEDSPEGLD